MVASPVILLINHIKIWGITIKVKETTTYNALRLGVSLNWQKTRNSNRFNLHYRMDFLHLSLSPYIQFIRQQCLFINFIRCFIWLKRTPVPSFEMSNKFQIIYHSLQSQVNLNPDYLVIICLESPHSTSSNHIDLMGKDRTLTHAPIYWFAVGNNFDDRDVLVKMTGSG